MGAAAAAAETAGCHRLSWDRRCRCRQARETAAVPARWRWSRTSSAAQSAAGAAAVPTWTARSHAPVDVCMCVQEDEGCQVWGVKAAAHTMPPKQNAMPFHRRVAGSAMKTGVAARVLRHRSCGTGVAAQCCSTGVVVQVLRHMCCGTGVAAERPAEAETVQSQTRVFIVRAPVKKLCADAHDTCAHGEGARTDSGGVCARGEAVLCAWRRCIALMARVCCAHGEGVRARGACVCAHRHATPKAPTADVAGSTPPKAPTAVEACSTPPAFQMPT
mmetsp:Transcript_8416/g.25448  ORF Transcript_8416/g.25448 Transcript_8416/m.25448 type:complete len:274 (-) Transcript_8416:1197-2018(-)|eukprot:347464-Chlamydomonas_euryale.AAC.14